MCKKPRTVIYNYNWIFKIK